MAGSGVEPLLKLERVQTRLRMSRSQLRFWWWTTIWVWLLSAVLLFGWRIGPWGRMYLWPWLQANAWLSLSPSHRIWCVHGWYPASELVTWLTQTIYHQSLTAWLWDAALLALLPAGGFVLLLVSWAAWPTTAEREGAEHVRGVHLMTLPRVQTALAGRSRSWRWWRTRLHEDQGMRVAGVTLPRVLEDRHVLVSGATGTGKSTLLRALLRQLAERGETAVVVDPEGELLRQFYWPSGGDVVLNPFDARCPAWSPWDELGDPGDAEALAHALIPESPNDAHSDAGVFFRESARTVFVALLEKLPTKDPHALPKLLASPPDTLSTLLADTPAAPLVDLSAPQQRAGILATLQLAAKSFAALPPMTTPTWSAKQWAQARPGWLFLSFQNANKEAALPLVSVWFDAIVRRLLDTDPATAHERRVWLVIDELAMLQRQPHLEDLLTRGRKHGAVVVLGFQAITQLRAIYGPNVTATMLAAPATKVLLRSNEPETAQWCSDAIGKRDVIRPQFSEMAGPENVRDGIGTAYQYREEPAVLASEIQYLPDLQGYCCIAGVGVTAITIPLEPIATPNPGFLPREETQTTQTTEAAAPVASSPPQPSSTTPSRSQPERGGRSL
jgi:energy-coupling factor transporter ATP-binding protein EcfA2